MTSSVVSHYATAAIDALVEVAKSPTAMSSARVQAARAILDEVRFQELSEAVASKPTETSADETPNDTPLPRLTVEVEPAIYCPGWLYLVKLNGSTVAAFNSPTDALSSLGIERAFEDVILAVLNR